MVGDDSVELPFKVITLETTATESYYSLVFHYNQISVPVLRACRLFATNRPNPYPRTMPDPE
jgi:hypothetical protein